MPTKQQNTGGFHYSGDVSGNVHLTPLTNGQQFTYMFENFFHPLVGELIAQLNQTSVAGMLDPTFLQRRAADFFTHDYTPLPSETVVLNYSKKTIDVQPGGPYANYNW